MYYHGYSCVILLFTWLFMCYFIVYMVIHVLFYCLHGYLCVILLFTWLFMCYLIVYMYYHGYSCVILLFTCVILLFTWLFMCYLIVYMVIHYCFFPPLHDCLYFSPLHVYFLPHSIVLVVIYYTLSQCDIYLCLGTSFKCACVAELIRDHGCHHAGCWSTITYRPFLRVCVPVM